MKLVLDSLLGLQRAGDKQKLSKNLQKWLEQMWNCMIWRSSFSELFFFGLGMFIIVPWDLNYWWPFMTERSKMSSPLTHVTNLPGALMLASEKEMLMSRDPENFRAFLTPSGGVKSRFLGTYQWLCVIHLPSISSQPQQWNSSTSVLKKRIFHATKLSLFCFLGK